MELFRIGWIWRVQQMTKNSSKFILFGLAETILVDILKVQYIYFVTVFYLWTYITVMQFVMDGSNVHYV